MGVLAFRWLTVEKRWPAKHIIKAGFRQDVTEALISLGFSNRGDRTPLELLMVGVAAIEGRVRARLLAS